MKGECDSTYQRVHDPYVHKQLSRGSSYQKNRDYNADTQHYSSLNCNCSDKVETKRGNVTSTGSSKHSDNKVQQVIHEITQDCSRQ